MVEISYTGHNKESTNNNIMVNHTNALNEAY